MHVYSLAAPLRSTVTKLDAAYFSAAIPAAEKPWLGLAPKGGTHSKTCGNNSVHN